jgi:glycosyltransferase involved in cell wall biosynthesis
MKILIVSQYFWPEEFRINDLATDLVDRGHEVTVLTGSPNYPKGKFYTGYGFNYKKEYYKGVKLYRVPIIPRGSNNFYLLLNYISFLVSGSVFSFFHKENYDKVFAVNFSPITSVIPAIVYSRKRSVKLYLWVQDLWPESVFAASNIKSKKLNLFLTKIVKYIYANSSKILVQSKGFFKSISDKGVSEDKILELPNWAEDLYFKNIKKSKYSNLIPKGFVIMFAGNIGEAQDFGSIVQAALLTKSEHSIKWVIIGGGRKLTWLKEQIIELELENKIILLGRYPVTEMPDFFIHADVMLVSLKKEEIFSLTIPSKIQSYLASGKPIIGMLDGVGSEVIKNSECGFYGRAGDFKMLYQNIIKAYSEESSSLIQKGLNGRHYYDEKFSKKRVIDSLVKIFNDK